MLNKRLLKEVKAKPSYSPLSIIHGVFNSAFTILNAYLLAFVVNSVFIKKVELDHIKIYIFLLLLNAIIRAVVGMLIEYFIKNHSEVIKDTIKNKIFHLIISSNPFKLKSKKPGEVLTLLTEGMEMLTPYYSQYITQVFASVIVPLMICISVLFVDRLSALIMLITYPLIPLFMTLIGYKSKEVNEKQWIKLNTLNSHFLELLQGLRTLKIFGRDKFQELKVFQLSESFGKAVMDVLKISFLSALVLETAAAISTAVIAVNLGLRLVYGKIDFFNAFFVLVITPEFYIPLRQLGLKFHSSLNAKVAIDNIENLEKAFSFENNSLHKLIEKDSLEIEIKNLNYSYESIETLNNISFKINYGEKIALVGESGCGKSTLISLLTGFLKTQDNMIFINGKDINQLNTNSYRDMLALVPQFPHIFNMSIEDNIMLGSKNVDYNDFLNICRLTKVDQFAEAFINKYKTFIGDGEAVAVSGGERQRISLARALIKKANFIIMDEPTSALDPDTEELVPELIFNHLKNTTALISSHRLNIIKNADKILVLKGGSIVETGSHEELIKNKGLYYNMVAASKEKYENI
jgi:ATP-binding cassette, subfamily C, bacterial CydD